MKDINIEKFGKMRLIFEGRTSWDIWSQKGEFQILKYWKLDEEQVYTQDNKTMQAIN